MLFSSVTFLYYFLPVVLTCYFLVPMPRGSTVLRNVVLLAASIVFYMWGEPVFVLVMLGQTFAGWIFGLLIEKWRNQPRRAKAALVWAIIVSIAALGFFKYADFFIENVSQLTGVPLAALKIALPIGISFYTFQILSYDIDLYRGNANVQRNFLSFATYVTIFPPLIAGPIVRYVQIENELGVRRTTLSDFADGIRRFVIGLGKKVLIANVLGELVAVYQASDEASVLFVWLYVVAYALHIYFDFSGYSDMAIGIGRMFGFRFPENFNYPYIAASVTDFWRRWHMSLSSWFRDYVYIPLGGNRVPLARHVFNIALVWFLTGFWHGAGWNFILWGLFYAVILLLEKYAIGGILAKLPILSHLFVILCFLVSWIFFDAATPAAAATRVGMMFGVGTDTGAGPEAVYYLRSYLVPLLVAGVGATPLPARVAGAVFGTDKGKKVRLVAEPIFLAVLLITVTAFLVDGSFNPFIYFRF
ncbi:alginate regulatory protein [Clostridia bacterium]|nr:alginate regulatory protein [Clostridia bacterium]